MKATTENVLDETTRRNGAAEPIAIIGMGCRFPGGANSPEAFWRMLLDKVDGVVEVPRNRWSIDAYYHRDVNEPGHMVSRRGGFIDQDIESFDATFFGVTPREAVRMDPQQRLFLETTWDALEDAGIRPEDLAGSRTAVFVGTSGHDHGIIQLNPLNRYIVGAHTMTGVTNCILANRVSYLLDLRGPSVAVDTACSSSLVAVHLAVQSLRSGESTLAITGGVNLLLNPNTTIGFSRGSFLSPDGRCKAFDRRANGYVRAEGSGTIILKPLARALADGDPIYAVIRGTASNQDGRTAGISLPSREAQERLLLDACADAQVEPHRVGYVEAHGTGTAAGDPIEATALGRALSKGRDPGSRCVLGAVKTNIGHLESSAGIAGLVKAALVLEHKVIPANLHFREPNPQIPFEELKLRVPTEAEPWPATNGTRFAGVNSFGFGGANAHVLLEEAPQPRSGESRQATAESVCILPVSAKSRSALTAYAQRYAEYLQGEGANAHLNDIGYSAARHKAQYDHRLAVVASSKKELVERLQAFAAGERADAVKVGQRKPDAAAAPKVFVFSGQGPQWWAMGRELLKAEPVFREVVERCHRELSKLADWSLMDELLADEASSKIGETYIAQPAVFALQAGLATLWRSWGVEPDAVVGHSIGEIAAAYVSGALSFEDAVQVIFHRSRIQQKASGKGKMLAIGMSQDEAERLVAQYRGRACIGAVNGLQSIALSGDPDALEEIATSLSERQIFAQMLRVKVAFHSHHMDPLEAEVRSSLSAIRSRQPTIPMYSTVTGQKISAGELTADYWWRNIREPVVFSPTIARQIADGHRTFVEVGPHPIHGSSISELVSRAGVEAVVVPSLIRKKPEQEVMLGSLAELYVQGVPVDLIQSFGSGRRRVKLPTYPWQRERYWLEAEESLQARHPEITHPLRGRYLPSPDEPNRHVWDVELDTRRFPWIKDHRVQGPIVFPAAGYMDMALGCMAEIFGESAFCLEDVQFRKALFVFDDRPAPTLQLVLRPDKSFGLYAKQPDSREWVLHVSGRVAPRRSDEAVPRLDLESLRRTCASETSAPAMYQRNENNGLQLGQTFKAITGLWRTDMKYLARLVTPETVQDTAGRHAIHPGLLDSGIQALSVCLDPTIDLKTIYLPVRIDRVTYYGKPGRELWSHGEMVKQSDPQYGDGSFVIFNDDGSPVIRWEGFRSKALESQQDGGRSVMQWLHEFVWTPRVLRTIKRMPADFLPDVPALEEATKGLTDELRNWSVNREYHDVVEPKINRLGIDYVTEALYELGYRFEVGDRFTAEQLMTRLGVISQHARYFQRLLTLLSQHGVLSRRDGAFVVERTPERRDTARTLESLRRQHPTFEYEYRLLERCGRGQAGVLRGDVDPIELIFRESEFRGVSDLYDVSFSATKPNRIIREVIRRMVARIPETRPFRVLEIGAGTGGTTAHVLPELPADRAEYAFTDIGQLFLAKAKERFRHYGFVEYRELDIEKDLEAQGFRPHYYDLVIASNVLHATPDLTRTIQQAKRLISSRGYLLVVEATYPPPYWVDLSFGLTEGWWKFQDLELRHDYPLLTESKWREYLRTLGFANTTVLADTKDATESGNPVILARMPEVRMPVEENAIPDGAWIVLDDAQGVGRRFLEQLGDRGAGSVLVRSGSGFRRLGHREVEVDPTSVEDFARVLGELARSERPCAGVLHLWNLDYTMTQPSKEELRSAELVGCYSAIALLQAYTRTEWKERPLLWIGTRGTQALEQGTPVSIAQSPSWGVLRVLVCELADVPAKILDLEPTSTPDRDASWLVQEYTLGTRTEEEVAFRGQRRYVHRLGRVSYEALKAAGNERLKVGDATFRLPLPEGNDPGKLGYQRVERVTPGEGEVEIRVQATALNFRDIMLSLGLLPEGATLGGYYGANLGVECAGEITRVGPGVTHLRVGDRVAAFAVGCFGSHVTTSARYASRLPDGVSVEAGTTIPMAFLTAYHALVNVGRLAPRERVLIHAGAGGVGLAAIQIALTAGAEVYATAGRPDKRKYLETLGVRHVFDSRSTRFLEEIRAVTSGEGVDVVLNSLSGEFIQASLEVLRDGGRFLEIGKQDIQANAKLGLKPFENNLSYAAVDIDKLLLRNPALCARTFETIMEKVRKGEYRPLATTTFPADEVEAAFRHMTAAKHIGKVVVTYRPDQTVRVAPPVSRQALFREDGTYLVTGGVSGFGLRTAQWMVERGARTVVLASRRGRVPPEEAGALEEMRRRGANVILEKVDVGVEEEVKALLARMRHLPPLRGVYHAAMVLDDTPLTQMSAQQFLNAVTPKMDGAWYLHKHTQDLRLDHFVMYSSMSYLVGTPGQGNYAAGNAFLDALAYYRRSLGLHALTINWGVISEVGYVARTKIDTLARLGWKPVSPERAFQVIEECLVYKPATTAVFGIDWGKMSRIIPVVSTSDRFRQVIAEQTGEGGAGGRSAGVLEELKGLAKPQALAALQAALTQQIAKVFDMPPERLDANVPLTNLGMDSLMGGQIRNWIATELSIDFPTMGLMRGPTIAQLAAELLSQISGEKAAAVGGDANPKVEMPGRVQNPWLHWPKLNSENASIRVFTFPFVGGGASVFTPWPKELGATVEVIALQYPGRDTRISEPPIDDMSKLVAAIVENMAPHLDRAFVIYGHSMGGLVAYEVTRYLQTHYSETPLKLIIGGWPSPALTEKYVRGLRGINGNYTLERVSDEEVLEVLRQNQLFSDDVIPDTHLLKALMPSIRADLKILGTYRHTAEGPLHCPVTVLSGSEDTLFSPEQLQAWRELTTGPFKFERVPGGHLFIKGEDRRSIDQIAKELEESSFPVFSRMEG